MIRAFLIASILPFFCGCPAGEAGKPPKENPVISQALPRFERDTMVRVSPDLAAANTPIAILAEGTIVLAASTRTDNAPLVVFKSDSQLTPLGRPGRGPGEIQTVADLFVSGNRIVAYDMSGLKLVALDLEGADPDQHQFQGAVFPFQIIGDSIDLLHFTSRGRLAFQRTMFGSSATRTILDENDSTFLNHFVLPFEQRRSRQSMYPARASNATKLAVADPMKYRIYEYDVATGEFIRSFGREIPAYRRSEAAVRQEIESLRKYRGPDGRPLSSGDLAIQEDQLRSEILPFFGSRRGMIYDEQGRLWVVGARGDSVAVDLFADSTFLGRVSIPCSGFGGSWARSASRAAFVCVDAGGPRVSAFKIALD